MLRAIDTVSSLSGQGGASEVERRAQAAVKQGDFRPETALSILEQVDVPFSTSRPNVTPVGEDKVRSMLLGLYGHGTEYRITKATLQMPWVTRFLLGFLRKSLPDFPCTSIQLNVEFASRPHVDRRNFGPSAAIALGSFTGGEIWAEDSEGASEQVLTKGDPVGDPFKGTAFDVKNQWLLFDGNRLHFTQPYQGARISLIFFGVAL